ncbi:MAG: prenyltransferase [Eggerthellaceae bacterium]|nr:prenyltransferase [Eggerthellaceae bacterium]
MALNLAAPHTWPAAIMPTLIAISAASNVCTLSISMCCTLLAIVILMQSAVNTFNDYYDYVKGTDSEDDNVDESDAVLVYNDIDPKEALRLAVGMLVVAFILGIYAVVRAGFVPLVIALVGALFVVLYSAGKSPISYLPLGEAVSGIVMGGLIPLAVYQVITNVLDFRMLFIAIPTIIGVGLIMLTNNTCDIERDIPANRKTLPVLLGREAARKLYHVLLVVWVFDIIVNVAVCYTAGLIIVPFMLLASYPIVRALWMNPLTPERRLQAMPQALSVNVVLGAFYAASILAAAPVSLVL